MAEEKREKIEAYVFRKMVEHFDLNKETVQNIDVMNTAGFCRNCLSKWYYLGASKYDYPITYDEACEVVYGMPYAEWKQKYQKKATQEQLDKLTKSKDIQAKHPGLDDIAKQMGEIKASIASSNPAKPQVVQSDVCCELPGTSMGSADDVLRRLAENQSGPQREKSLAIDLGIITISDRASKGIYEDESGPEIEKLLSGFAEQSKQLRLESIHFSLVSDDQEKIKDVLVQHSDEVKCNLILTTGGTGLSPRDVTPEATKQVVHRLIPGILETARRETYQFEPLSLLSRGVAGVRIAPGHGSPCLIINLPGRPKAVREFLLIILPMLPNLISSMAQ